MIPEGYVAFIEEIKTRVQVARARAVQLLSAELVRLYWQIGRMIDEREKRYGWGAKIVEQLSVDLRTALPGMRGFSPRNLRYMRDLAVAFPDDDFARLPIANVPWGHVTVLLDQVESGELRSWYAQRAIENGWSRAMLLNQIKSALHARQGQASSRSCVTRVHPCAPRAPGTSN